jgi:hypothetical protein
VALTPGIIFIIFTYHNPIGPPQSPVCGYSIGLVFILYSLFPIWMWASWIEARLTEDGVSVPGNKIMCKMINILRYPVGHTYASWDDVTDLIFTMDGLCIVRTRTGKDLSFFVDRAKRDEIQGYFNQFMRKPTPKS